MNRLIKLAVAEDDDFYRALLVKYLQSHKAFEVIMEASNGQELTRALEKEEQKPDVVILDYEMPVMDGAATTQYLSANYSDIKILILTVHKDERISNLLIKNGANGFLVKENGLENVADAIHAVCKYRYYFTHWDLQKIIAAKNSKSKTALKNEICFSPRQLEIIHLLSKGYSNKEISAKLFLSIRTIEEHRDNMLQKTKSRNIAQLAIYAVQHDLIELTNGRK